MNDSIQYDGIVLPADGQRSFEELREEFREANRQRIRRMLRKDSLVRYRKDGTVAGRLETGLMTDAAPGMDWRTIRDFKAQGGLILDIHDEFVIPEGPGLERELRDLSRDAAALALHEGVIYPNDRPEENHADKLSATESNDTSTT